MPCKPWLCDDSLLSLADEEDMKAGTPREEMIGTYHTLSFQLANLANFSLA